MRVLGAFLTLSHLTCLCHFFSGRKSHKAGVELHRQLRQRCHCFGKEIPGVEYGILNMECGRNVPACQHEGQTAKGNTDTWNTNMGFTFSSSQKFSNTDCQASGKMWIIWCRYYPIIIQILIVQNVWLHAHEEPTGINRNCFAKAMDTINPLSRQIHNSVLRSRLVFVALYLVVALYMVLFWLLQHHPTAQKGD